MRSAGHASDSRSSCSVWRKSRSWSRFLTSVSGYSTPPARNTNQSTSNSVPPSRDEHFPSGRHGSPCVRSESDYGSFGAGTSPRLRPHPASPSSAVESRRKGIAGETRSLSEMRSPPRGRPESAPRPVRDGGRSPTGCPSSRRTPRSSNGLSGRRRDGAPGAPRAWRRRSSAPTSGCRRWRAAATRSGRTGRRPPRRRRRLPPRRAIGNMIAIRIQSCSSGCV